MHTRRLLVASGIAAAFAPPALAITRLNDQAAEIEKGLVGGRIGVAWLGPGGGTWTGYREKERFVMCSTFKAFLAADVLDMAQRNMLSLAEAIPISKADLVPYAPVVEAHIAEGSITREELCRAAVTLSDNAAANLLLRDVGGPAGLTRFLRRLGDPTTRLDRIEPALNTRETPDDTRDTSSPLAYVRSLRRVLFGGGVAKPAARQLADWMRATQTGGAKIRAGVPAGWDIGDKTGNNGDQGLSNDIAFFRSPTGATQMLAVFVDAPDTTLEQRDAAIAAVARVVVKAIS